MNPATAAILLALALIGTIIYGNNQVEREKAGAEAQSSREGTTNSKLNQALGAGAATTAKVSENPVGGSGSGR